jgi:glutaconate CoA-transferase subunit A
VDGARWVGDVDELVAGVHDGERISVSGFHFVRAPIAQLKALVNRSVRHLTYVAWGGGLPLELLLSAGAVDRLVFCFSSFDIFGLAPRFRRALEQGTIEVEEWTALGFTQALEAEARGLSYSTLQAPLGSELYRRPLEPAPRVFADERAPMAVAPPLEVDTFLLHAQRADLDGNVEIAGARGCDLSSLFPARRILVTVEEQVPNGTLGARSTFIVPRSFVSAISLAPLGAYPTSCLPYYATDYALLRRLAARKADEPIEPGDLEPRDDRAAVVREVAQIPARQIAEVFLGEARPRAQPADDEPYSIDELMACCIARTIDDQSICSVGSVSPLATVAYLLAKRLWAPKMCLITYNGGFVDVPFRPMAILASEVTDFKTAVSCAGGDETYHWYYQRGMITHEVVSAAQIDRRGATNNIAVRRPDGSTVRLPGQGGMADVANMHRDFFLYLTRHSRASMVERVDMVSAQRGVHKPEQRRAYGYQPGATRLLTNLGQFLFDPEAGELVLTHLHPGVTLQDLQDQTGFEVHVAPDLSETAPPTAQELEMLRNEVDPLGIRRLEFVPSAERSQLIDELLGREEEMLRALAATAEGRR